MSTDSDPETTKFPNVDKAKCQFQNFFRRLYVFYRKILVPQSNETNTDLTLNLYKQRLKIFYNPIDKSNSIDVSYKAISPLYFFPALKNCKTSKLSTTG